MLRRGTVALVCVVIAATAAGRAAADGPKPERSPSRGVSPIHPQAAPTAEAAQSTQKTSASYQGSTEPSSGSSAGASSGSDIPPASQRPAVTPPRTSSSVRATKTPAHGAAKKDPPVRTPTKRVESLASSGGQILVTTAHGLTKAPSSSESLLLLLVGLALVVLVVGETTFLRLAARGPARQRAAEEPLPIRQVQLKR